MLESYLYLIIAVCLIILLGYALKLLYQYKTGLPDYFCCHVYTVTKMWTSDYGVQYLCTCQKCGRMTKQRFGS